MFFFISLIWTFGIQYDRVPPIQKWKDRDGPFNCYHFLFAYSKSLLYFQYDTNNLVRSSYCCFVCLGTLDNWSIQQQRYDVCSIGAVCVCARSLAFTATTMIKTKRQFSFNQVRIGFAWCMCICMWFTWAPITIYLWFPITCIWIFEIESRILNVQRMEYDENRSHGINWPITTTNTHTWPRASYAI